jgi:hemerythrin-like domain-containing protein
MHEHKAILLVLAAAEREVLGIQATGRVDAEKIRKFLDFFQNFADRCHHAKEERHLFKAMQGHGFPVGSGPIAVMLHDHDEGRRRLAAVAEALPAAESGDAEALTSLSRNLLAYVELLRGHIAKEDNVLYPMADRLFGPEEQQVLGEAFEKVEAEEIGEGVHERYHRLAHELAEES